MSHFFKADIQAVFATIRGKTFFIAIQQIFPSMGTKSAYLKESSSV